MQQKQPLKIAIVGAGLSGLVAFRELTKILGYSPQIFEKSKGVGGRLHTKFFDEFQFDLGAQYFTARNEIFINEINNMIQQKNISIWQDFKPCQIKNNSYALTLDQQQRYVGTPGMVSFSQALINNKNVQYKVVNSIYQEKDLWIINEDKDTYFDWLVLSIPQQQAKKLYPGLSKLIQTENDFLVPCWTVALAFEQNIETEFTFGFVKDSLIQTISLDSSKPERPQKYKVWVIHTTPQFTKDNLNKEKNEILDLVCKEFLRVLQISNPNLPQIPPVAKSYVHRWMYANINDGKQINGGYIIDQENKIAFCGDWLNKDGRIEGAFMSGYNLAQELGKMISKL